MAATHESTRPGEGPVVAELTRLELLDVIAAAVRLELAELGGVVRAAVRRELEEIMVSHDQPAPDPSGLGRQPRRGGRRRDV